jgi:hypothetical protein
MGFEKKGHIVIKVQQSANGQWEVKETGSAEPVATFTDKNEAFEYANKIAKAKGGSRVELA